MKFKLAIGVSFGAVFIASLVTHLPASWLWQSAPKIQGLAIEGISGTPWQGSAANVRWQNQPFGRLQWDMQLGRLLQGELAFNVRFGKGSEWQFIDIVNASSGLQLRVVGYSGNIIET